MACTGSAFLKTINALVYLNLPEYRGKMKLPLTWDIFFSLPYCCRTVQTAGPDLAVLLRAQCPNQTVAVFCYKYLVQYIFILTWMSFKIQYSWDVTPYRLVNNH
jgi:hypothetical protein